MSTNNIMDEATFAFIQDLIERHKDSIPDVTSLADWEGFFYLNYPDEFEWDTSTKAYPTASDLEDVLRFGVDQGDLQPIEGL